jgi:hypothetical protein
LILDDDFPFDIRAYWGATLVPNNNNDNSNISLKSDEFYKDNNNIYIDYQEDYGLGMFSSAETERLDFSD